MRLIIDGETFNNCIVKVLNREIIVKDSELSGWTLGGEYRRDIVGTYYNYTFIVDMATVSTATYDALVAKLAEPVEYHTMTVPYGQGTRDIRFYIERLTDTLRKMANRNYWGNLQITAKGWEPV